MVYKSLTEVPHNLKEGIDWLVALRGDDCRSHMESIAAALYDLLADKPIGLTKVPALEEVKVITKEFMERKHINNQEFVQTLLRRFNGPMDKTNIHFKRFMHKNDGDYDNIIKLKRLSPESMARFLGLVVYGCDKFLKHMKIPDEYKSAYSSEATWEASCAEDPEACAVVLVGIAPMLYTGLRSLKDASDEANKDPSNGETRTRLRKVLRAVGYRRSKRRANISVSFMSKALSDVDKDVLDILYDFAGFWAFY
ncbi:hypothetical protein BBBOND_0101920 [Babesia bigemina]|uniref:Uncharacterized protein n=1 Tax=Babesia bigemina TaxID=5866 RepID=A0A061CZN3_BABBI|nr:hypothetical protein BBBOND_0101920 [Babesia bigemina]CDR93863.1 hypothetical protein BBBOND_0101920 [Babesia bigemina]|eukprot:XP_012766049.1 hypothetical protein BBBOND_0101920 [Babesia bigemina]